MPRSKTKYKGRPGIGYKLFKAYIGLFQNKFYYRNVYWLQTENIPDDVPLMIVSNHQNGLNDPLGVIFSVPNRRKRKIRFIARADVFLPAAKKALSWLGILPAYRNEYQGEGSAAKNRFMMSQAEEELNLNGTVGIYPEAGHQDKHWLGKFSIGYLHIIFEAARLTNFQKEMFVIPSCNHYSNYFRFREQMLVKYGEPISLAPYYDLYQKSPRRAQAEVNDVIRQHVSDLMLNITDLENYDAIDFLRNTYGREYARRHGLNPKNLSDKLISDKRFFAALDERKTAEPEKIQAIYDDAMALKNAIEKHDINDRDFNRRLSRVGMLLKATGLLLFFPLFLLACIPNYLVYLAPKIMTRGKEDVMLHGGINLALSAIVTVPLFYILTFFLMRLLSGSWYVAAAHLIALPFLAVYAWNYSRAWVRWKQGMRLNRLKRTGMADGLNGIRNRMYSSLDYILG